MQSLQERHPKRIDIVILILLSIALLIIGLTLPILTVRKLWDTNWTYPDLVDTCWENFRNFKYFISLTIINFIII